MENCPPLGLSENPCNYLECSLTYTNTQRPSNAIIPSSNEEIDLMMSRLKHQRVRLLKSPQERATKNSNFMKLRKVPCCKNLLPEPEVKKIVREGASPSLQKYKDAQRSYTHSRKIKTELSQPSRILSKRTRSRLNTEQIGPSKKKQFRRQKWLCVFGKDYRLVQSQVKNAGLAVELHQTRKKRYPEDIRLPTLLQNLTKDKLITAT